MEDWRTDRYVKGTQTNQKLPHGRMQKEKGRAVQFRIARPFFQRTLLFSDV